MSKVTARRRKRPGEVIAQARRVSAQINEGAAAVGVETARALCPVSSNNESGHVHLRDTIRAEVDEQTGAATMVAGDPERGVTYAPEVEYGHTLRDGRYIPGHFFFASGVEEAKRAGQTVAAVKRPKG
jgi:hypothetical protein